MDYLAGNVQLVIAIFGTISRPNFTDLKLELYYFLGMSYRKNLK